MLRAVLDANVFISALLRPAGPPGRILAGWLERGAFELILSPAIVEELRRALSYRKVRRRLPGTDEGMRAWLAAVELLADIVPGVAEVTATLEDPEDAKYLSAAVEGRAQYIVSGDAHLLTLGEYQGIRIVTPRAFLEVLGEHR